MFSYSKLDITDINLIDMVNENESISTSKIKTTCAKDEQEPLEFMMVVSAFYFPSDDEQLEEELPQVEYPKPANKSSPLYNQ
jgi:hypothetical protein